MWKKNCLDPVRDSTDDKVHIYKAEDFDPDEFWMWKDVNYPETNPTTLHASVSVKDVLDRLAVVQLKQRSSGKDCIFASYHGPTQTAWTAPEADDRSRRRHEIPQQIAMCEMAIYLVKFIASEWNVECDVIFGGDFNFDLESNTVRENEFLDMFYLPATHSRLNGTHIDWIIAFHSNSTTERPDNMFVDGVNVKEVFPLSERSRIWKVTLDEERDNGAELQEARRAAERAAEEVEEAEPSWEPIGWKLLAKLYETEHGRYTSLYKLTEEGRRNLLDHSPMIATIRLN
ncbi:hypothetical protein BV898_06871 [Hypsibius exemplaris]|uniref:Endonuclease/exonuclease/phosphatase domain-containing protein n=1 Tax=Hypsibius exemplaris TaxID=2072580 RepID=A0A1W0WV38_HYPEX|nr:hypothetical protein BV898_06871 [Hypsibius exemplaris]